MNSKICSSCLVVKNVNEFCYKNRTKLTRQSACKICTRKQIQRHYYSNRSYYLNKAKKRNESLRADIKEYILNYLLTHPCVDCKESDILVLEFDHVADKHADISSMLKNRWSLNKIEEEIKKCEVRCANCHRRKTAQSGNWYRVSFKQFGPVAQR